MLKKLLVAAFSILSFSVMNAAKQKPVALASETDSLCYAIGINVGTNLRVQLQELPVKSLNYELFTKAILSALNQDSLSYLIKTADIQPVINDIVGKAMKRQSEERIATNKVWLENNMKNDPSIKKTASGLQYKVLTEGTGEKPRSTDNVKVHYHGTFIDGKVFDSSIDRGQPAEFAVNKVITGWTEGLQLMNVGSKYIFYIPSDLAYGPNGSGPIPGNSILIFTVELLEVKHPQPKNGALFQFPMF